VLHQSAAHVVETIPRIECFPVQPLEPGWRRWCGCSSRRTGCVPPFGRPTRSADAGDGTGQVVRARGTRFEGFAGGPSSPVCQKPSRFQWPENALGTAEHGT